MYASTVQDLIDELGRLPGIGPKSAQRIAFHLLKVPADEARRLARSVDALKERMGWCSRCFNVAERAARPAGPPAGDLPGSEDLLLPAAGERTECEICRDPTRDPAVLCVVEEPKDVVAVERTRWFRGRYHVLQGTISPIDGVGPDQLRVRELLARIDTEAVNEVILCVTPTTDGEATILYLAAQLRELPVRVTRVASGLPVGGDLEYADEITLGRALEGRRELVE